MLMIKPGVRIHGLRTEMVLGVMIVESVFKHHGYDTIITSGIDGKHMPGSEHYKGDAVDFRTRHVPDSSTVEAIASDCKSALGADFDVVLETTHLHVEYDPKAPF